MWHGEVVDGHLGGGRRQLDTTVADEPEAAGQVVGVLGAEVLDFHASVAVGGEQVLVEPPRAGHGSVALDVDRQPVWDVPLIE